MNIAEFASSHLNLKVEKYPQNRIYFKDKVPRIYFICTYGGTIVYIGRSQNLAGRILTHKQEGILKKLHHHSVYFFDCPEQEYKEKEWILIRIIKPHFNKWGKKVKSPIFRRKPYYYLDVDKLKAEIEKRGWNDQRFANEIGGTDRETVVHMLKVSKHAGAKMVIRISKALDISFHSFIQYKQVGRRPGHGCKRFTKGGLN